MRQHSRNRPEVADHAIFFIGLCRTTDPSCCPSLQRPKTRRAPQYLMANNGKEPSRPAEIVFAVHFIQDVVPRTRRLGGITPGAGKSITSTGGIMPYRLWTSVRGMLLHVGIRRGTTFRYRGTQVTQHPPNSFPSIRGGFTLREKPKASLNS